MSKNLEGIYTCRDIYKDIKDLYEGKTQKQYETGFDNLDPLLKIIKPSFMLITGTPNSGKSSFTLDLAQQLARLHDFKFCIYSPESSLSRNVARLVEKYCEKPFDKMFSNRITEEELNHALAFINEHFYFIDMKDDSPDIKWILEKAEICRQEFGIDCLITDPYNEINPARASIREDEHISILISDIKRWNREHNMITMMVAHPTKQTRTAEGQFVVNSLYDVSGSAHWNNKADVGIIVTRDYEDESTLIRIAKIREIDVQGTIGECKMRWSSAKRVFIPDMNYEG